MVYALRHYSLPLLLALALHAIAALGLYRGWNPETEVLNVVKPRAVMAKMIVMEPKPKPKPKAQPKPAPQAAPKPAAQPKKAAPAPPKDTVDEKKLAQEKAAREKAAREAEQARQEQERLDRLAQLAASSLQQAIDEESAEIQADTEEAVVQGYHTAIYELVRSNWSRPPSARIGMEARLRVELIPTGEVVAVTVVDSSGNGAFDRSAENAVRRAKRFEVPQDNALFERHFRNFYLLFKPEDLLR